MQSGKPVSIRGLGSALMPASADPSGNGGYPNDDLDKQEGNTSVQCQSIYGSSDAIRPNRIQTQPNEDRAQYGKNEIPLATHRAPSHLLYFLTRASGACLSFQCPYSRIIRFHARMSLGTW